MYDVIVVGAGPGGAATAHYLAQGGAHVLLLDKAQFPRDKTCGDGLTPRALGMLADMGILSQAEQLGMRINGVHLHAKHGNQMRAAIPQHATLPDYLLIVPRFELDDLIRNRALRSGAAYREGVSVRDIQIHPDHALVHAEEGAQPVEFKARLVVIAVGASISLLKKLGILTKMPDVILAARAYYEDMLGLDDYVQAHFEHVPLPGYGWVFPISPTAANIGIGYWASSLPWNRAPQSARIAMQRWIEKSPKLRAFLSGATPYGPIKGYPLRVDFPTAPTFAERILLVGESAGLVSPLTGEGIDFALESGMLAAQWILDNFKKDRLDYPRYDAILRHHFQHLFVFLARLRRVYINPILMNRTIAATEKFPELKDMLVKIMMGQEDAANMIKFATLRKVVLGI
jgi:geranylgeranyl reductase family protein